MDEATAEQYRAAFGNPGEIKLHEALSSIEDWLDYEAAVVAEAAEEITDPDIAEAAEEQAEAMEEAAEAVGEAAEEARETAAEVFSETGEPSSEATGAEGEAVKGNPVDPVSYVVVNTNTHEVISGPYDSIGAANEAMLEAFPTDNWDGTDVPVAIALHGNPGEVPDLPGNGIDTQTAPPTAVTPKAPVTGVPDAKPESPSRYFRPVQIGSRKIGGW